MGDRLAIVSAERIRDELDKLMVVDDPSDGLWFLVETGLADEFLPELLEMRLEQDPIHHHKDVLAHTIAVVANTEPDRLVRLAALFHDVGKPKTRSFGANGVMFHHHEVVGARMTKDRMTALRYPNEDVDDRHPARAPAPALPRLRRRAPAGPTRPCAASSGTPATSSTGSSS